FVNIVIAEGARNIKGDVFASNSKEIGYENVKFGGVGFRFEEELKMAGCEHSIRTTVLGHLQRGGIPIAYDRVLATQYGVKAFELAKDGEFGRMVSYRHPYITSVTLKEAIQKPNLVDPETALMKTARGVGMCFGD
ncbi:MAG TPA: 6-phosphofructokinase, partial [Lentimicrobium sp.]|nr:6-phosphofructokinase [Lentimicrobium sp.]